MDEREQNILLSELRNFPAETEWIEFKTNNDLELGEYLSALSNSACIHDKPFGYLVFGIEDKTHRIVGTDFDPNSKAKGNEDLIPWLTRLLNPRMHFEHYVLNHTEGRVVIFKIKATTNTPVTFQGTAFIRIGSYKKKLAEYPEKERLIWTKEPVVQFENEIAKDNLGVDDVLKLLDYPAYFDMMNLPLPSNKDGIIEKLKQENLNLQKPLRNKSKIHESNLADTSELFPVIKKSLCEFGDLFSAFNPEESITLMHIESIDSGSKKTYGTNLKISQFYQCHQQQKSSQTLYGEKFSY